MEAFIEQLRVGITMTIDATAVRYTDIVNRTIKLVVVDGSGAVLETFRADTGFDPMTTANASIARYHSTKSWPRDTAEPV